MSKKTFKHGIEIDSAINRAVFRYKAAHKLRYGKIISIPKVLRLMCKLAIYSLDQETQNLKDEHKNYNSKK